jgi:hypothetical protein
LKSGDESLLPLFCTHEGTYGADDDETRLSPLILSIIHLAAYVGHFDYVTWKIEKCPSTFNNDIKLTRLFHVIWSHFSPDGNLERLKLLLNLTEKGFERGLRLKPCSLHFAEYHWDEDGSFFGNIWESVVIEAVGWVPNFSPEEKRRFSQLMKILLDCGADPELELDVEDGLLHCPTMASGIWFRMIPRI